LEFALSSLTAVSDE
jgi:hypothetical protein